MIRKEHKYSTKKRKNNTINEYQEKSIESYSLEGIFRSGDDVRLMNKLLLGWFNSIKYFYFSEFSEVDLSIVHRWVDLGVLVDDDKCFYLNTHCVIVTNLLTLFLSLRKLNEDHILYSDYTEENTHPIYSADKVFTHTFNTHTNQKNTQKQKSHYKKNKRETSEEKRVKEWYWPENPWN